MMACEQFNPAGTGPVYAEKHCSVADDLRYGDRPMTPRLALQSERQRRDGRPSIGASYSEPACEHGPGFVGDIGERSDAHPVQEIESNSTSPMALPFINNRGANHGDAQAR
jgi:hypothetical protein